MRATDELIRDVATDPVARAQPVFLRVGQSEYELVGDLREAVLALVAAAGSGSDIDGAALPTGLTTGQAADLLGVSRPTVVKLIDRGELPARRVGTRRRLAMGDVLAFRRARESGREAGMREVVVASEELGLYD